MSCLLHGSVQQALGPTIIVVAAQVVGCNVSPVILDGHHHSASIAVGPLPFHVNQLLIYTKPISQPLQPIPRQALCLVVPPPPLMHSRLLLPAGLRSMCSSKGDLVYVAPPPQQTVGAAYGQAVFLRAASPT